MSPSVRQNIAYERTGRDDPPSTAGVAKLDQPIAVELESEGTLPEPSSTLTQHGSGRVPTDGAWNTNLWIKGSLLKHIPASISGDDKAAEEGGERLVVAAGREANELLGVALTAIGDKISVSECKQLAKDGKAMFVTDGACELPQWLAKQCYASLVQEYHHPEFKGLRVGQLTCVAFSDKDEYQPLAAGSCSASLSDALWGEAKTSVAKLHPAPEARCLRA